MKKSKTQKGITLVALIITIIVLLILAVVAIGAVRDDGIIQYAKNARSDYETAQREENDILAGYLDELNDALPEGNQGGTTGGEQEGGQGGSSGGEQEGEQGGSSSGDQTGTTLASQITPANYGDYIAYNVDVDGNATNTTDWKIFYKEGDYVYLISSNSIQEENEGAGVTYDEGQGVYYWQTAPEYQEVSSDVVTKFKAGFGNYNTADNGRCASTLLNPENWTKYAAGIQGAVAIGSPTLEMFIASYNAKSNAMSSQNYGQIGIGFDTTGYVVKLNDGDMGESLSYPVTDMLYNCENESAHCFWFANPISSGRLYSGHNAGLGDSGSLTSHDGGHPRGFRPVVCLPAGVTATLENGTWTNLSV